MTYTYDGDGERVKKSTGTLYYGGSGTDALSEANASGAIVADYVFFAGKRIARIDNPGATETVHYYLSDHLGSHSVVASAAGVQELETMFFPYGGERWSTGTDSNHYKFTGKERDSETGLDYFGARYYASNMGRWTSPDWAAKPTAVPYANFGNPQSLNLYSYVQNNPTTLGDPDGHCPDICDLADPNFGNYTQADLDRKAYKNGQVMRGVFMGAVDNSIRLHNAFITMGQSTDGPIPTIQPRNAEQWLGMKIGALAASMSVIEVGGSSVWTMGPAARGLAIERGLGGNLPRNFPVIDKFLNGMATSIKSLDLGASTYQNLSNLTSKVTSYIDKVAAFNGARLGETTVAAGQITGRELQLAIPQGASAGQRSVLNGLSSYADSVGVKLTVTVVK